MSETEGRLYPDFARLLDPEDAEFSCVMNSLMHIEKGNGQNFKNQRDDAANELIQRAKGRRDTANAPSPEGKTWGNALGASLAGKAGHSKSDQVIGSIQFQKLLSEWHKDPPYALFWAEVQEGYHGCLKLMSELRGSRDRALELASEFEKKLSNSLSTDSAADTAHSVASSVLTDSQLTMSVSDFLSLLKLDPPLSADQP